MNLLLTCNWQNVIDAIPCFCWGVLILTLVYLWFKNYYLKLKQNQHESKMKEDALKREIAWSFFNSLKASIDEQLNKSIKEENMLKVEKAKNEMLEKRLQVYKEFIELLNMDIKPKEK